MRTSNGLHCCWLDFVSSIRSELFLFSHKWQIYCAYIFVAINTLADIHPFTNSYYVYNCKINHKRQSAAKQSYLLYRTCNNKNASTSHRKSDCFTTVYPTALFMQLDNISTARSTSLWVGIEKASLFRRLIKLCAAIRRHSR